ncbi:uncharacterized protein LOC136079349 [Hydra vulgaris]|uniref:Uncharacterized protein LOC136079348 n=1 Tax=Hydra vulgaris TaxID=6087 RepID=A0ABM4BPT2_HYDVU
MSFLKITDPEKRNQAIEEYKALKKIVQQNALNEKIGESNFNQDLTKLYSPLIESQSGISKGISKLKDQLALTFPNTEILRMDQKDLLRMDQKDLLRMDQKDLLRMDQKDLLRMDQKDLYASKIKFDSSKLLKLGKIVTDYLRLYTSSKKSTDTVFGIHSRDGELYLGKKPITIDENNINIDGKNYIGTKGLWELITKFNPNKEVYNNEDIENYRDILLQTDVITSSNPNKPKSSRSEKYNELISPIWKDMKGARRKLEYERKGSGVGDKRRIKTVNQTVILPSDPNVLVEMLELRIAAWEAGNNSSRNEALAICDELLRQGEISSDQYIAINKNHLSI